MDFSQAQQAAHAEEFANTMMSQLTSSMGGTSAMLDPDVRALQHANFVKKVLQYQQGCVTHFQRLAMRIKQDRSLVPTELVNTFDMCLMRMLSLETSRQELEDTFTILRTQFPPLLSGWLDWWYRRKASEMIFPASRVDADDFRSTDIPRTSNPIETQHSLLHHATGTDHDLLSGFEALFRHVKQLEKQYNAALGAHCLQNPTGHPSD